jgi:hypothetical protein
MVVLLNNDKSGAMQLIRYNLSQMNKQLTPRRKAPCATRQDVGSFDKLRAGSQNPEFRRKAIKIEFLSTAYFFSASPSRRFTVSACSAYCLVVKAARLRLSAAG